MKIFLLGNANSIHVQRWAKGLAEKDVNIFLFSLSEVEENPFEAYDNIELFTYGFSEDFTKKDTFGFGKSRYLKVLPVLKKMIKKYNPNIVHAHYASGYGTLGALSGFHPYVLSVWGSDIYEFPKKSIFHRQLIRFNLRRADKVLSTSYIMAKEIRLYNDKEVIVVPFGIDLNLFKPLKVTSLFEEGDIVVGTVKTLDSTYGINYLIKSFRILVHKYPEIPLKLLIVGKGPLMVELKSLVVNLKIEDRTCFTGEIAYQDIPRYHNMLTVAVYPSLSESFGVAVVESSACAKPVVVSDAGGLPEVVEDGVTGIVVPSKKTNKIAQAIEKLILDSKLRDNFGEAGRKRVEKLYNWNNNVMQMVKIYEGLLV